MQVRYQPPWRSCLLLFFSAFIVNNAQSRLSHDMANIVVCITHVHSTLGATLKVGPFSYIHVLLLRLNILETE